jgi:hypothetical protein
MNILFISIFDLTKVFFEISKRLDDKCDSYWIVNDIFWKDWLIEKGVNSKNILYLDISNEVISDYDYKIYSEMQSAENMAGVSFNEAILMDRFVNNYSDKYINNVVMHYYKIIKKFLIECSIKTIFAEPTNLHEIVTFIISRELSIDYYSPWDMRFPSKRLIFTRGILQSEIVGDSNIDKSLNARNVLDEFRKSKPEPTYVSILNHKENYVTRFNKASKKFLKIIKGGNGSLTYYKFSYLLSNSIKMFFGSLYLDKKTKNFNSISNIEYAYFPLHVQPENSVDVLASFQSNQLELVKNIVRSLPYGMKLIVKEHKNQYGSKGYFFYREICNIKNVIFLSSDANSFDLYKESKLVFSISGTAAYESAMLGVPTIVFSPMFFDIFHTISYVHHIKDLQAEVLRMLSLDSSYLQSDYDNFQKLLDSSHPCYWTDPIHNTSVLDEENLEKLSKAFQSIIFL